MSWGIWTALTVGLTLFLLYRRGVIPISSKRALLFYGSAGGKSANFTSCTGRIQRILRVAESRNYHFQLRSSLTKGEVSLTLSDTEKVILLHLRNHLPEGDVWLEKGRPYTLKIQFDHASGSYDLFWE